MGHSVLWNLETKFFNITKNIDRWLLSTRYIRKKIVNSGANNKERENKIVKYLNFIKIVLI